MRKILKKKFVDRLESEFVSAFKKTAITQKNIPICPIGTRKY